MDEISLAIVETRHAPLTFPPGRFDTNQLGWGTQDKETYATLASSELLHWIAVDLVVFDIFRDHHILIIFPTDWRSYPISDPSTFMTRLLFRPNYSGVATFAATQQCIARRFDHLLNLMSGMFARCLPTPDTYVSPPDVGLSSVRGLVHVGENNSERLRSGTDG